MVTDKQRINGDETILAHCDTVEEFVDLLDEAETQAESAWEMEFVASWRERFGRFGARSFMTEKQFATLRRIAGEV